MPRYVHFTHLGKRRWGRAEESIIQPVEGNPFETDPVSVGQPIPLAEIELHVPTQPTKIVCVGRNYQAHAAELNNPVPKEPLLFLKPPSCLIAHKEAIEYPTGQSELVHHEGELAIVIGRRAKNVPMAKAFDVVRGYTILNDVTARDLQRRDVQFTRGKGFDTFGPCGPWIDTDFIPGEQALEVSVNGEVRQKGLLSDMIFSPADLLARISRIMTLEPGDIISTGTPAGVGALHPGDSVEVSIEGLGTLENHVKHALA
jgi:2-keto-4-pentenoate hydratase/2-oxohepta-3-ene-1,7-dioic acid hydratase in catechol pathway